MQRIACRIGLHGPGSLLFGPAPRSCSDAWRRPDPGRTPLQACIAVFPARSRWTMSKDIYGYRYLSPAGTQGVG